MNLKILAIFLQKKINYYCYSKLFLKTDLTDCHIYIYETVVHVQINYSGIRCDISSLTNTVGANIWNVQDNH